MTDQLLLVVAEIQRRGGIGRGDLVNAVAHAGHFAEVAMSATSIVDLGSGGGLPGLVVAVRCPNAHVTLIERRSKRCDLLRYGVRALDLGDRVVVYEGDVRDYLAGAPPLVDVVTARSFGAPEVVVESAAPMLNHGGVLVVSEPPGNADRWDQTLVSLLGFRDAGRRGPVRCLERVRVDA